MELGLTIPLRRHLKMDSLPHGETPDREACWDLHVITLRGRKSLLAVHCRSRYAFVLFGLSGAEWEALPATFLEGASAGAWTPPASSRRPPGNTSAARGTSG